MHGLICVQADWEPSACHMQMRRRRSMPALMLGRSWLMARASTLTACQPQMLQSAVASSSCRPSLSEVLRVHPSMVAMPTSI